MSELEFQDHLKDQEDERLSVEFLSDLHDYMDQAEVQELNIDTSKEGFRINSREQAGFFIRKLQEARAEAEQINLSADKEIQRLSASVNTWREKELNRCNNVEGYIISLLQDFAARELEGSDKKSLKLPFGTLAFKSQQDKYEYDDKVLLDYLKQNKINEFIRIKEEPNKVELKKNTEVQNGKLLYKGKEIAGVTVTPQEPKFEVK